jgi:hypothetical protein
MASLGGDSSCADMCGKECRQARRVATRHRAFGCYAVDTCIPSRRPQPRRIALHIALMNEAEVELALGVQTKIFERRKIGIVGAVPRHRHMEPSSVSAGTASTGPF